jgi:hypothetical protein
MHVVYLVVVDICLVLAVTHLLEVIDLRKTSMLLNKEIIDDEHGSSTASYLYRSIG